jgi:hypothetical protein
MPYLQGIGEDVFVAFSDRYSLVCCLFLTALWSVLGAAACGCYFAVSNLPASQLDGILPAPLEDLDLLIAVVMLPVCLVLPAAGRRYLRTAASAVAPAGHDSIAAGASARVRWMTAWTGAVLASSVVEAYFILRLYWHLRAGTGITGTSSHALEFSIAFLVTGAAMTGVLIIATAWRPRPA